jgi:hypothetical protein
VVSTNINPKTRRIEVTLVGEGVPQSTLIEVAGRLQGAGLMRSDLKVFQTGEQRIDVVALKSNLLGDLYKERLSAIPAELHTLYPQIGNVILSEAPDWSVKTGWQKKNRVLLSVRSSRPLSKSDQGGIEQWLRIRLQSDSVRLVFESRRT